MKFQVKDLIFANLVSLPQELQYEALTLRNQESVRRQSLNDRPISEKEHWAWVDSLQGCESRQVWVMQAFGKVLGVGNISGIMLSDRIATVGWYIDTALQGSGLGIAIAHHLLSSCFDMMNLEKVEGEVISQNTAALQFNKSLGFEVEGLRRSCIVRHGVRLDIYWVGILKSEWDVRRPRIEAILQFMRERHINYEERA